MKLFKLGILFFTLNFANGQEARFGSLALDEINGNQYGWAVEYTSLAEANKRAIEECQKNGGNNCHTVLWFEGGCGVFVVDFNNPGLYGWGAANTRAEAENIARAEASKRGGANLTVRVWGCNGDRLKASNQTANANATGIYLFHHTEDLEDKKFYISNLLYEPDMAVKRSDSWYWSSNAETKFKPAAVRFWDAVANDKYSYLSPETRKKVIQRNPNVAWEGANEIDYANAKISLRTLEERRASFQGFIQALTNQKRSEGFKIVEIDL